MKILKIISLLILLLSGCCSPSATESNANYYLNPVKNLSNVGRVAFIELSNYSAYPTVSEDVTGALFEAIQKKQFFSLNILPQNDPVWRSLQFELATTYTIEQLSIIRKTLNCDALLVGSITGYKPYPYMFLGIRLKLIDLSDGQLLWAYEQVWDSNDKKINEKIENYYDHNILPFNESLEKKLGTVSSLKFIKFAAYETAESLQNDK